MNALEFLGEWAIRSSVLIAAGALVLLALRVKDSSIRLAAWVALLSGSLAIPLMTVTLPSVPVIVSREVARPIPAPVVDFVSAPVAPLPPHETPFDWMRAVLILYVAVGFGLLLRLLVGLAMSRRLLRGSRAVGEPGIRESEQVRAPVTLGIWRPVIVLPLDWREWDSARLDAVLAHERSHIERFDPAVQLLSAVHRAVLWFSPASWFLHSRIVRVAEEASDDAAMAVICDRASYAELLLEFMRRGVCGAGVPMARYGRMDRRIQRVLDGKVLSRGLTRWSVTAVVALGSPLAYVVAMANPQSVAAPLQKPAPVAQPPAQAQSPARPAPVAKPQRASGYSTWLGMVVAVTAAVKPEIDGQLKSVSFKEGEPVQAGQVIATIDAPEFSIRTERARSQLELDEAQLVDARDRQQKLLIPPEVALQLEAKLGEDKAHLQEAERQSSATQVRAPITGIAGLRLIEPGNNIHTTDAIVTIAQVQPIAVLFSIPEDLLTKVRALMGEGVGPTVEAWNRDNTVKLATGHLTAIDNQIDEKTGTVKLKATFDNKDSALFPNQFVNVRLLVQ